MKDIRSIYYKMSSGSGLRLTAALSSTCFRKFEPEFWCLFVVQIVVFLGLSSDDIEPSALFHCSFLIICIQLWCFTDEVEDLTWTQHILKVLSCMRIKGNASPFNCMTVGWSSGKWRPPTQSVLDGWHLNIKVCNRASRGPVCGFLVFWLQIVIEAFALFHPRIREPLCALKIFL